MKRLVITACLTLAAATASAGVIYVTPTGTGTGTNWTDDASLTNALTVANESDELWLAQGTYTNAADAAFSNGTADLTLYGGFTTSMSSRSERDWDAYPAWLDGQATRRVLHITANTTLDGLTIKNGYARYEAIGAENGSGIYSPGSADLTLNNCRVEGNHVNSASSYGQGLYASGGSVTLSNTVFARNSASDHGHHGVGVYASGADVSIVDCVFTNNGNALYAMRASSGGALRMNGGTLGVANTLFVNNHIGNGGATGDTLGGGAVYLSGGVVYSFMNCIFRNNSVYHGSEDSYGGTFSVHTAGTTGVVENCTIVQSRADKWGGAIWVKAGAMVLKNCILWTNSTRDFGHDIATAGGLANVSYCNLSGDKDGDTYLYQRSGTLQKGSGLQSADPRFASNFDDLHLKSKAGRWDPTAAGGAGDWVTDAVNNFCIDKGEPGGPLTYTNEPTPNGARVNLGAYANTWQASKTPALPAPVATNIGHGLNLNNVTITGRLVVADTVADVFIHYGKADWAWDGYLQPTPVFQETGTPFSATKTGLDYSQTYYYRCFATNAAGTNWAGNVMSFTTGAKPPGGPAGVIHVWEDAPGGETGDTWYNAFTSMADATDAVNNPNTNTIWVAAGHYSDATANITEDVNTYGGFTNGMTTPAERDPDEHVSVIDGAADHRCVYITGGTVLFDGMTISNGTARYEVISNDRGSGINSPNSADLTFINCRVVDNTYLADKGVYGIGLHVSGGSVTLTNTVFAGNRASVHTKRGTGLYASGADVSIVDCVFSNNYSSGWNHGGGALWINGGTLGVTNALFVDNTLSGNTPETYGGGAAVLAGGVEYSFLNCVFRNNWAWSGSSDSFGGTFSVQGSTTTGIVENCTIVQSKADKYGGAVWVHDGSIVLKNCILWSNTTRDVGYDVAVRDGFANVSYCNLSGDKASIQYLFEESGTLLKGDGLQWVYPRFASDFDDVHLQSTTGRWDQALNGGAGGWTNDAQSSLCIDKGQGDYGNEPDPNGGALNLGAYGNTWQASKTPPISAPVVSNVGHGLVHNYVTITGELVEVDTIADVFIYYGTNDWVWNGYIQPAPASQEFGIPFSASKGDLAYDQTYYYRCFASNPGGTNWADNVMSFTTGSEPAGGPDNVIHVKAGAEGTQSGYTWFDACHTLADGLTKVQGATNEIWTANRYERALTTFLVATNVSIYGGFVGTETSRVERSLANETLLDGEGARRVMNITAGTVTLDGLTITNGAFTGTGYGLRASGTYDLTLANCVFTRNGRTDSDDGAGAYFGGGTVFVTNCTFSENGYGHGLQGGGFYGSGADVTVVDCLFTNNGAPGYAGRGGDGGAIYQSGGKLAVIRSDFIENDTGTDGGAYGGAVSVEGSASAGFTNCVFRGNTCTYQDGRGDGGNGAALAVVVNAGYTVEVVNCTFAYNTGANRGGAIHANSGSTIMKNCILWSNEVSDVAGADATGEEIYARNAGTTVTITYSDLTGTNGNYVLDDGNAVITPGPGLIAADPRFASATDLHLRSKSGRWDPSAGAWVNDSDFSPCIDAGDIDDDYDNEPIPHGKRINLGAYGNTAYASKSKPPPGSMVLVR